MTRVFATLLAGALGLIACTQAVLTPFAETEAQEPPDPALRTLVTLAAPQFEALPEGTLLYMDILEWEVVGVPAFMAESLLRADFSVSSDVLADGQPVHVVFFLEDPSMCPTMPPHAEATGHALETGRPDRVELVLEPLPEPFICM